MTEHLLNKKTMAKSLGISTQAFDKWDVKPCHKEGRQVYFSVADVVNNRLENYQSKHQPKDAEGLDIVAERARLTFHQANIAELDEEIKRGELIPSEVVEQVWSDMVASFRAKILSIPTKAAHQFVALTEINEIQDALKEHHHEALQELSEYDSKDYGIEINETGS